jgi:hypothetical protein
MSLVIDNGKNSFRHWKNSALKYQFDKNSLKVKSAYKRHLEQLRKTHRATMVKPSEKQAVVEKLFPVVAKWVQGCGHIEIGEQGGFGFTVRANDFGGIIFEDDKAETLAEAMAALEHGLTEYFEQEGIE